MKVSIVIPVYNIEEHLSQCLSSVIAQDYPDIEIICVDDGSTDSSPLILKQYAEKDPRILILSQNNAGPGVARNTGLKKASGDYLIFLDSDDWFEPDMISSLLTRAEETKADITICHSVEFDTFSGKEQPSSWMLKEHYLPSDSFLPEEINTYLFQFTFGWPWDKLYRTDFVRANNLVFPPLKNSEDLVFVFQSLAFSKKIAIEKKTLVHHRVNRLSSVSNSRKAAPEELNKAVDLLEEALIRENKMGSYQRSFMNWKMEFLIWNVANMGDLRVQKEYFNWLKTNGLEKAGFDQFPKEYYFIKSAYLKYTLVKKFPYDVFNIVLQIYKAGKSLLNRKVNKT